MNRAARASTERITPAGIAGLTCRVTMAAIPTSCTGNNSRRSSGAKAASSRIGASTSRRITPAGERSSTTATGVAIWASTGGGMSSRAPSMDRSPAAIPTRSPGSPTSRLMVSLPSGARTIQRSNRCRRRRLSSAGNAPLATTSPGSSPGAIDRPSTSQRSGRAASSASAARATTVTMIGRRRGMSVSIAGPQTGRSPSRSCSARPWPGPEGRVEASNRMFPVKPPAGEAVG